MTSMAGSGVGMFAISWLASRCLSPLELGFFLSFLSFGALFQLADFGLSYTSLIAGGTYAGPVQAGGLAAVGRFISRWNALLSVLALAGVALLGTWTFRGAAIPRGSAPIPWAGPWLCFLLGSFAVQLGLPAMSLREGAGKASQMWRLRLIQELAGATACLAVLFLGGRLWCAPVYVATRAAVVGGWLRVGDPLADRTGMPPFPARRWFREHWGFQWRIGLSILSGYLIFRAVTPILFAVQGPVAGGQYGLALAVMNLLIAVTGAWPMSQTAYYRSLLATGQHRRFDAELPRILVQSTALAALAAAAAIGALWLARGWGLAFAVRMADLRTTGVLLSCAVVFQAGNTLAVFLRAEGREPLLLPSTVGGAVTVLVLWQVAHRGRLILVAEAYLVLALVGAVVTLWIYLARRRARSRLLDSGIRG